MSARLYLLSGFAFALALTFPGLLLVWRQEPVLALGAWFFAAWLAITVFGTWQKHRLAMASRLVLVGVALFFVMALAVGQGGLQALALSFGSLVIVSRHRERVLLSLLSIGWMPGLPLLWTHLLPL